MINDNDYRHSLDGISELDILAGRGCKGIVLTIGHLSECLAEVCHPGKAFGKWAC